VSSVLGIDVGSVRVGIAGSDPTGMIASPLETLPRRDTRLLWSRIAELAAERECALAVVGLPRRLDGSEGAAAADARTFAGELEARTGLTTEMWDERFTTVAAERSMIEQGVRRRRRRESIDSVAASLMLQGWLEAQRNRARR